MLGLGETTEEVLETLADLRSVGCDFLTLGQYLQPSGRHLPVARYLPPEEFDELGRMARLDGLPRSRQRPVRPVELPRGRDGGARGRGLSGPPRRANPTGVDRSGSDSGVGHRCLSPVRMRRAIIDRPSELDLRRAKRSESKHARDPVRESLESPRRQGDRRGHAALYRPAPDPRGHQPPGVRRPPARRAEGPAAGPDRSRRSTTTSRPSTSSTSASRCRGGRSRPSGPTAASSASRCSTSTAAGRGSST